MRIKNIQTALSHYKCDALLVVHPTNIRYLTGFPSVDSWFCVSRRGCFYITDARYAQEARHFFRKRVKVVLHDKGLVDGFSNLARACAFNVVGFDSYYLSYAYVLKLKKAMSGFVHLRPCDGIVERYRLLKDADELALIREALSIHRQAHHFLKGIIKPQVTEKEILLTLQDFVFRKGATFSFTPIIASGVNSSYPHAMISDRKVKSQDILLIDMGIDVKGYKSDLTRMFFLDKIPPKIRTVLDEVFAAQQIAIEAIKPGVPCATVAELACKHLKNKGLDKYFLHALGHGVGMDVHEKPSLSVKSKDVFQEGMVVTVEPGIYFLNAFGVRLEEMVLVTKKGSEVLSDNIH